MNGRRLGPVLLGALVTTLAVFWARGEDSSATPPVRERASQLAAVTPSPVAREARVTVVRRAPEAAPQPSAAPSISPTPGPSAPPSPVATVVIDELRVGDGEPVRRGQALAIRYRGWNEATGREFDGNLDAEYPFQFALGMGEVLRGWDQGMDGMRLGGIRRITIPPELGYPDGVEGLIDPGQTLVFEVELVEIRSTGDSRLHGE